MTKGLPDIDSFAAYGGALANYAAVVNPTTDEDVAFRNLYAMNVAMMTHTAVRGIVSFIGNASAPTDPGSGFIHDALWGSLPAVKPTFGHPATGEYVITFPTSIDDDLGTTHTIDIRRALAQVECDATLLHAVAKVTGPSEVTVRCFDAAGTANDLVGSIVTAWIW